MGTERDTVTVLVRVPRREIAYFNFLLESYEGLASVSTLDPKEGVLELQVPPELMDELKAFLSGLKEEIPLELLEVNPPQAP